MYFILGKRCKMITVYAATSYTRPETASLPFPLERIEEMTRLIEGDEGAWSYHGFYTSRIAMDISKEHM